MRALEVATAQVHGKRHARWFLRDDQVDELRVAVGQLVGVVAPAAGGFAHFLVAQVGQVGVVHLHVGAARCGERAQFITIRVGHVLVKIRIELRVMLFADAGAPAAKVQHGGRGDSDFSRAGAFDLALQVLKVGQLNILGMAHFVDNFHHGRGQLFAAVRTLHCERNAHLHAAQLRQKISVEISAAKLAIGDALEADVLLELDDVADGLIFNQAQLHRRDAAIGRLVAGLQKEFGAQKTADMVVSGGELMHEDLRYLKYD